MESIPKLLEVNIVGRYLEKILGVNTVLAETPFTYLALVSNIFFKANINLKLTLEVNNPFPRLTTFLFY